MRCAVWAVTLRMTAGIPGMACIASSCSAVACSRGKTARLCGWPVLAGAKLDREQVPGVKLKTENKKPIVGLAVHPAGMSPLQLLKDQGRC